MFGQFPSEYPDGQVKYVYLDLDKMVTEFLPGVYIPLEPFPGTIGVARKEPGRYSTVPPGEYAGNMDIRDFIEGTTLYVPVYVPGALLWTGDSHAAQGNGEVNLTALETAYKEFNITVTVLKDMPARLPAHRDADVLDHDGLRRRTSTRPGTRRKAQTMKFLAEQRNVSADRGGG